MRNNARGLQGDDPKYLKVAACAKHFAVHSGPEALRHGFSANVSRRDMAEYYFPAFRALVQDAKAEKPGADGSVRVSVEVSNTGARSGDEVVQAYVRAPSGSGDRRRHHLEGFARVSLAPGERRTVSVVLPKSAFAVYDEAGRPSVPAGESTVFLGGGQPGFSGAVCKCTVRFF